MCQAQIAVPPDFQVPGSSALSCKWHVCNTSQLTGVSAGNQKVVSALLEIQSLGGSGTLLTVLTASGR